MATRFRLLLLLALLPIQAATLDPAILQLSRDIFRTLIEIDTTESTGSTTAAAEAMAKRLRDAGFPATDISVLGPNPRFGNMVARLRGTGARKPILLLGHLDVVEARRQDWTTDPFRFVEKDGFFYGRGTQDMKAQDAILMTALIRLRKEGYRPNRDIILALTAGEESGLFNGVDWLLKQHRDLIDAEYVLNADAGSVFTANGRLFDVEVEATEKLYADFQLTVKNSGGHSSLPVPDNAIYHLTDALGRLERYTFPLELNAVTRGYFRNLAQVAQGSQATDIRAILRTPPDAAAAERLSRDPIFNATVRTTCIATRLNAGHANNALPQTAQAVVNCRILPGHSAEEVRKDLVRILGDPQVSVGYIDPPTKEIQDHAPAARAFPPVTLPREVLSPLEHLAAEFWPGAPVVPDMETGASDSAYTIAAGIPSYGFSGLALERSDVRAHGRDERIAVSSFYAGVEFYYRFLKALTSQETF